MHRIAAVFTTIVFLFYLPFIVSADDNPAKRYEDLQNQIRELEGKLSETKNREKTLSSQISYMDNQTRLTSLRIDKTINQIDDLAIQIASLSAKIDHLEVSLTDLSDVLLNRIVATYKRGKISMLEVLFGSGDFGDFLLRLKYIRVAQNHDKQLMFQMQETKDNFTSQKMLRQEKKQEQEELKKVLEQEKIKLVQQKKDKEIFLQTTRSDEKRYQELLAAARAEQSAIESALRISLASRKDGSSVKKGDQIAIIGNSGSPYCSTGAHLHLEFRHDNSPQNPAQFLRNISVIWDNGSDGPFSLNGDWDWPISNPRITQGFGMTYWARTGFYGGGPHTGIDMISETDKVVRAPKDGTLYRGAISCRSAAMNYVAIDHGGGISTWYFHVQ